jgi:hypothetical protein
MLSVVHIPAGDAATIMTFRGRDCIHRMNDAAGPVQAAFYADRRYIKRDDNQGASMKKRSILPAGATGVVAVSLPRFAIGQPANARILRFVPQANLTVLDPIITTASVSANHGWMVWDTLFCQDAAQQPKPQMAEDYTVSDDGRTYLIRLRDGLK